MAHGAVGDECSYIPEVLVNDGLETGGFENELVDEEWCWCCGSSPVYWTRWWYRFSLSSFCDPADLVEYECCHSVAGTVAIGV